MDKKELSQLYYLKKDIKQRQEHIKYLEAIATKVTANTEKPAVKGGTSDKSKIIITIVALKDELKEKQLEMLKVRSDLLRYIETIPDAQTRLIFRYRFVDGCSWRRVAFRIGGNNSEDGVKKICYRYIKKNREALSPSAL